MRSPKKIKKIIFAVAIISTIGLQAQHKPFQFGFKGAVNIGWFATDTEAYENDGVRVGGSWGFIADFFMMENYSFTTGFEVLYLNGRSKYPTSRTIEDQTIYGVLDRKYNTRYLQVPISFTMKTNEIKEKFKIYGQIGYGLSFLLKAKAEDLFTPDKGETISENSNITDELTFTRSSLILAAGVEIPIHESTYIRTGFKFDNCFVNMFKGDQINARNNFIEFSAAVIF